MRDPERGSSRKRENVYKTGSKVGRLEKPIKVNSRMERVLDKQRWAPVTSSIQGQAPKQQKLLVIKTIMTAREAALHRRKGFLDVSNNEYYSEEQQK